ncbi:NAD(P)/FAD-dependent oxidoreductase [Patescibacteria group bacterium]|nr:NAD(P)/FAD-dependent oxidoreductase [Patescibacteria group bacterium]
MDNIDARKKNIVILGAGFGGITAALALAKKQCAISREYNIILVDRHRHQLYTPALYEIASIPRENAADASLKSAILIPIADITAKKPIQHLCDDVIGLDRNGKKIILKNAELPYEFLVSALGSETNYFNIPGLKEESFPLKTFDDAVRLRNKIEDWVREKDAVKIVVGGAGASGVELVAEFVNFVCDIQKKIDLNSHCKIELLLIESSPDILPGFDEWAVSKTKKRLAKLGVRIKTNATIVSVRNQELDFADGNKESFDILIWAGGVQGPAALERFELTRSKKGALVIDEYLRAGNPEERIFAIGDNSSLINPKTGKPLMWNVPVAEAEGRLVAKNIIREIRGKPLKKFIPLKKYPFILAVGKKYAIADFVIIRIAGRLGWCLKQLVELRYFLFILPLFQAIKTWLVCVRLYASND